MTEQKTDTVKVEPTCLREYLAKLSDAELGSKRFLIVLERNARGLLPDQPNHYWSIESMGDDEALIDMARVANEFAAEVAAVRKPEGRAH